MSSDPLENQSENIRRTVGGFRIIPQRKIEEWRKESKSGNEESESHNKNEETSIEPAAVFKTSFLFFSLL